MVVAFGGVYGPSFYMPVHCFEIIKVYFSKCPLYQYTKSVGMFRRYHSQEYCFGSGYDDRYGLSAGLAGHVGCLQARVVEPFAW